MCTKSSGLLCIEIHNRITLRAKQNLSVYKSCLTQFHLKNLTISVGKKKKRQKKPRHLINCVIFFPFTF